MAILVAYYSRTGTVKRIAQKIAQAVQADIEEIRYKEKLSGIMAYVKGCYEALTGRTAGIEAFEHNPADYDLVVLGLPVWAGRLCPQMAAFLKRYGGSLKSAALFIVHADGRNQYEGIFEDTVKIIGKPLSAQLSLCTKDVRRGGYDLTAFIEKIQKA